MLYFQFNLIHLQFVKDLLWRILRTMASCCTYESFLRFLSKKTLGVCRLVTRFSHEASSISKGIEATLGFFFGGGGLESSRTCDFCLLGSSDLVKFAINNRVFHAWLKAKLSHLGPPNASIQQPSILPPLLDEKYAGKKTTLSN
ncbi:hypothetical protein A1359_04370 [Methylomonas lenta]|uniref:Uncharacterized protein n=1 Tax=Methylomonas lenta TaxID=980561 RepID=A0A177NLB2_9GAMM|nr:hypothetical protein A1359_04370 [Methylomonas lenta]